MELAQVFGWIATGLFSLMIIPQMIKTIKSKDTKGVSLLLFVVYLIANAAALVYAFFINQFPLILKYEIAILNTIVYIILFVYYSRRQKRRQLSSRED